MRSALKLGLVAAVIAVVVVAGVRLVPGDILGAPAPGSTASAGPTPTPTLGPDGFGGTVTFAFDGAPATLELVGSLDGEPISGIAVFRHRHGNLEFDLRCLSRDGDRWAFAGQVTASTTDEPASGTNVAVLAVDGARQRVVVWNTEPARSLPCPDFLESIPPTAFTDEANDVLDGRLVLPDLPGS